MLNGPELDNMSPKWLPMRNHFIVFDIPRSLRPVRADPVEVLLDAFVEDVAEAIERAWATPNLPNDIYTITCGQQYSIGDMLAAFQRAWPEIAYRVVPESDANYHVSGDPPGPRPSNARMQQDLGWVPSTPLDDGVQQYIDWIRANGPQ